MTQLEFLVSFGLGGAVIVSGGVAIILGTFFRWKWLVDPQVWGAHILRRMYGKNAFTRLNYIYGTICVLTGAALLWFLSPVLTSRCH